MLSGSEDGRRGKEGPMDLDSSPTFWQNSSIPSSPTESIPQSYTTSKSENVTPQKSDLAPDTSKSEEKATLSIERPSSLSSPQSSPILFPKFRKSLLGRRSSPLARRFNKESSPETNGSSSRKTKSPGALSRSSAKKTALVTSENSFIYYPYIVMGYLQMAFNIFAFGCIAFGAISFFLTVKHDVQIKVDEQLSSILSDISSCSKQYAANRCAPDMRVPAMEEVCQQWEKCMRRDPSVTSRAKLSAETLGEILNGFFEVISLKTMIFILLLVFGTIFLSNYAFSMARDRFTVHPSYHHNTSYPDNNV